MVLAEISAMWKLKSPCGGIAAEETKQGEQKSNFHDMSQPNIILAKSWLWYLHCSLFSSMQCTYTSLFSLSQCTIFTGLSALVSLSYIALPVLCMISSKRCPSLICSLLMSLLDISLFDAWSFSPILLQIRSTPTTKPYLVLILQSCIISPSAVPNMILFLLSLLNSAHFKS